MPFKSKAQRRFFYAAENRGDLPKGTAEKWEEHTPKGKKLPEHVKKSEVPANKDPERWNKAKKAVEKHRNKAIKDFDGGDLELLDYLYHKLGNTKTDSESAEKLRKKLISPQSNLNKMQKPLSSGQIGVRTPKVKKMATGFDKPSKFFKEEKGVHESVKHGKSAPRMALEAGKEGNSPKYKEFTTNLAREHHKEKLGELKEMPKPNLPKSEKIHPNLAKLENFLSKSYKAK